MARYKVTTELKTPLWKKVLRWIKLIPALPTFTLILNDDFDGFEKGSILFGGQGKVKIIEILK